MRTFLTTAGIALGVAVLFASLSAGATVDSAVDRAAADEIGRADLRVSALEEGGLTAATLQSISQIAGVAVAAPALERKTYLAASLSQTASAKLPPPVTVLGIDPVLEPKLHDMPLTRGHLLADGDAHSALITQTLADEEGLGLGDSVTLSGTREVGPQAYSVVGIVVGNGTLPEADGRLVIITLPAAQALFGVEGVTRVDLGAARGTSVDELIGQLEQGLKTQPYLLSRASDLADTLRSEMADFRGALLLVAAVVLFAGAFLIFNTLSMTVAELTREVGLLRAAGTTRSQVMRLILLQALALGVVGSLIGVAAGIGLASVALFSVRSAGSIVFAGPSFSIASVLMTLFVGIMLTLAAALEPAWRAGRIPPVEALRRGPPGAAAGAARLRWLVVVFAVLAVGALVFWPNGSGGSSGGSLLSSVGGSGTWGPPFVFGLLLLTVLLVPRLLGPLVGVGGIPFRIFRNEERLARSALTRDKSRTTLTAGALVVGVAMIVALGTAAQDVRKIGANWLTETVPGSELLTSIRPVLASDPIQAELAAKPGVKSVSPIGLFGVGYLMTTQVDGRPSTSIVRQEAAAIVGADYLADGRLTFVEGDRTTALTALGSTGSVIVPESVAGPASIHLNDTLEFATGSTVTKLRCVGIVQRSIPAQSQEAMLIGWADAPTFGVTGADFFAIRYQPDMEATARPAVDADAISYALEPNQLDRVSGTVGDALDRIFRLLDALALIAVLVAGLGMVNTFSMSVLERVREIGVLRATGMTSGQVWGMVVIEAGILGIVGSSIGAVVGMVVGILLVGWSSGGFGFAFDPPWLSIALAFAFGILISVTASIYPAGLASRYSIVRALQHE
ncbi:MAG TPA: FtsX-like permease family protein [Candidatus Limnocylindrales bacterium]